MKPGYDEGTELIHRSADPLCETLSKTDPRVINFPIIPSVTTAFTHVTSASCHYCTGKSETVEKNMLILKPSSINAMWIT